MSGRLSLAKPAAELRLQSERFAKPAAELRRDWWFGFVSRRFGKLTTLDTSLTMTYVVLNEEVSRPSASSGTLCEACNRKQQVFVHLNMRVFLFVSILFLSTVLLRAQITFRKVYTPDLISVAYGVEQTSTGNILLAAGGLGSNGNDYSWLIKLDSAGNQLWIRNSNIPNLAGGVGCREAADGNYLFMYEEAGPSPVSTRLRKYSQNGALFWTKIFGDTNSRYNRAYFLSALSDTGCLTLGHWAFPFSNADLQLIRWDKNGDTLWVRTPIVNINSTGYCVKQLTGGDYILVGSSEQNISGYQPLLVMKISASGSLLWYKEYPMERVIRGNSLLVHPSGGYLIYGTSFNASTQKFESRLLRLDQNGDTAWTRSYASLFDAYGTSVLMNPDGTLFLIENHEIVTGSGFIRLNKADSSGNIIWSQSFTDYGYQWTNNAERAADGGVFIVGNISINNYPKIYLIKTDGNGFAQGAGEIKEDQLQLKIFPNPAVRDAEIVFPPSFSGDFECNLLDAFGRLVRSWTLDSDHPILNREDLLPGMYFLQLKAKDERIYSLKVLFQ